MLQRVAPAALGFALLTLSAGAQESGPAPKSALREFMRDAAKAKIQSRKPAELLPNETPATTSEPVKMAPFVVEEKRPTRIAGIEEEMQKQMALTSHALYHAEVSNKVRLEIGLPPKPGGKGGGFILPLLRLTW